MKTSPQRDSVTDWRSFHAARYLEAQDADTLDGQHAGEIADSGTFTPLIDGMDLPARGFAIVAPFTFLRTANTVRVRGTLHVIEKMGPEVQIELSGLPARGAAFTGAEQVYDSRCEADLLLGPDGLADACVISAKTEDPSVLPNPAVLVDVRGYYVVLFDGEVPPEFDSGRIVLDFTYELEP